MFTCLSPQGVCVLLCQECLLLLCYSQLSVKDPSALLQAPLVPGSYHLTEVGSVVEGTSHTCPHDTLWPPHTHLLV
jgi:hypothetical protein